MSRTIHPRLARHLRSARWAVAALSATALALAWSLSNVQAVPAATTTHGQSSAAAVGLAAPAGTGASDITDLGTGGWEVQSSAVATQTGAQISTPGFNTSTWLPVTSDDAGAPGTEIEALAQNGKCPGDTALQPVNLSTSSPNSVFFGTNMRSEERRVGKEC